MPDCRLCLLTPPALAPAAFASDLAAALDAGDVACVLLAAHSLDDQAERRRAVDLLRPVVQDRGVAFVVEDDHDLAAATGCDGVHIGPDGPPYSAARAAVGPQAIVGVAAGSSRHAAMAAAEQGADYVMLGHPALTPDQSAETMDLVRWWTDLMEVPCVAQSKITADTGPLFVSAGADFLAVDAAVWAHADGPAAGLQAILGAIESGEPAKS